MFKKLIACVALSVTLTTTCFAGPVDLSSYSDEEILEILNDVNAELANRGIEKTATLGAGDYKVDSDIPAGKYSLGCVEGDNISECVVLDENGERIESYFAHKDDPVYVTLESGQTLRLIDRFTATISSGVKFE